MSRTPPLEDLLQKCRQELLDLSTRNRLIHTRRATTGSSRSSSVEIIGELSDHVFQRLVSDGKSMTFLPVPEKEKPAADGGELANGDAPVEDSAELLDQPDADELDLRRDPNRHNDDRLQTPLVSSKLQSRLRKLSNDARTFEEEQGVNILFLAVGFLKWFEDAAATTERFAPLILVPVKLERQSAGAKFKLSALEEDLATNLSLQAKLKQDFQIALPDLPDAEELVPSDYFAQVEAAIAGQSRWQVLPNDMVLWFFSFTKFLMFRDLDPRTWPADASLVGNANIGSCLTGAFAQEPPVFGDGEKLDETLDPEQLCHVVDADGSQSVVIEEVRRGHRLVVQGPPGTGKSQTIVNLIAAAVKEGKRVLFVAEKMAALDVVKSRLDKVGLGQACLELHSNKANKKAVLVDLAETLEMKRPRMANLQDRVEELRRLRDELNVYVGALHTPLPNTGVTAYDAIGDLVRLQAKQIPPAAFRLENPVEWTKAQTETRAEIVQDVAKHMAKLGPPQSHPWRGVQVPSMLPADLQRLVAQIGDLIPRIERLVAAGGALAEFLALPQPESPRELKANLLLAQELVKAPPLDRHAIASPVWQRQLAEIQQTVEAGEKLASLRQQLHGQIEEHAWTTDLRATRKSLALRGKSWFRWLRRDYRAAVATLENVSADRPPPTLDERLSLCDRLLEGQRLLAALQPEGTFGQVGQQAFGSLWRGPESDWQQLRAITQWVKDAAKPGVADNFREVFSRLADSQPCAALAKNARSDFNRCLDELQQVFTQLQLDLREAFGKTDVHSLPLLEVRDQLRGWQARPETLHAWIAYWRRASRMKAESMADFAAALHGGSVHAEQAVDQFWRAYYDDLMREFYRRRPVLAEFTGESHEGKRAQFQRLDRLRIELARGEVQLAHYRGVQSTNPNADSLGDMAKLRNEMKKKRRHWPIRKLLAEAGHVIQAIKPVFMMSPTSIAQFLEPGVLDFDLLLIDEASQVRPVEAFGAMARCRQIVVVGDDRQLPPTNFFSRLMSDADVDEDEDSSAPSTGDLESILGLCVARNIRSRMLSWHYRSRHHSLIAVSNAEFYNNRLFVIPNPEHATAGQGLKFRFLADGRYDRGGSATNRVEARRVAQAVMEHARLSLDRSLGVGTFSIRQRDAILDELELMRRHDPSVEAFFATGVAEPFFVKNLENLQGDERDVIFISVGYGPDKNGFVSMNFGPLSTDGGERRLNVLISRARLACEVFSSIKADDIRLTPTTPCGTVALKRFLKYAETGLLDAGALSAREPDSVFEEQVAAAIRGLGYAVDAQVGVAGFFIDLAVLDPDKPGRYLLGVECDGATYHSARWARDRDRLRQEVIESRGWRLHRIWSTDWFRDPQEQLRRLAAELESSAAGGRSGNGQGSSARGHETSAVPPADEDGGEDIEVDSQPEFADLDEPEDSEAETDEDESSAGVAAAPYEEAKPRKLRVDTSRPLYEAPLAALVQIARGVVEVEGPVHRDEIVRRIAGYWGASRITAKMTEVVAAALDRAVATRKLAASDGFYTVAGQTAVAIRNRATVLSATLRSPDMLPPEEIRAAVAGIVGAHIGASADDVVKATSRLLGFRSTAPQLRRVIDRELQRLIEDQTLTSRGEKLFLSREPATG